MVHLPVVTTPQDYVFPEILQHYCTVIKFESVKDKDVVLEIASNIGFDVWYFYKPANFSLVRSLKQRFQNQLKCRNLT